jgi:hypothetical protein
MKYKRAALLGGQLKAQNLNELLLSGMRKPENYPKVA